VGFVQASGTLAIQAASDVEFKLANATTPRARVLSIGGTGLNTFVGINGPYRSDTNGDGVIDLRDDVNPNALGLSVSNAEFGVILAWDKTAGSQRNWIAAHATAAEVALVGVPGVTATAQQLAVDINLVNSPLTASNDRLEVLDLKSKSFKVYTGDQTSITMATDGSLGELIRATGNFEVSAAGFVSARGSMGFEKSSKEVQLADKSRVVVDQLLLGGSNLELFAGVGGPYRVDSNRDGKIDGSDTPNPSAVGFAMTGGEFAMAMLAPTAGQPAKYDGMSWFGIEASAASVGFVGVPGIDLQASNLEVAANQVFGVADGIDSATQVVDFKATPITVATGTNANRVLDVQGDRGALLRASGDFKLGVGGFFDVGGSLGFEKSVRAITLDDGSVVSHDVLTLGGRDLQAFAGLNGGVLVDSNHDGRIDSLDQPADPTALGFSLAGVDFGLAVASEREAARQTLAQSLQWIDLAVSEGRQVALARGATGTTSLWISTDAGQRWSAASTAPTGLRYNSVSISADGLQILATVDGGGIVRSADGGRAGS
jgi:hypothetical protein